jgi:DtxR family Mn-dependent transcriptional regulator
VATSNAEDYLKALYHLGHERPAEPVGTGELARRLNLTPGSVTGMLRRLQQSGLVDYAPHQGARLTDAGLAAALRVVRRHRLLELFLAQTLDMPWDEVHIEAELLEHSASERLIERIAAHLGHPEHDPHGDPIPDAQGNMGAVAGALLADCPAGTVFEVRQVDDSSDELLRYLREGGLELGTRGQIARNESAAGIVEIRAGDRRLTVSRDAAGCIRVRRIEPAAR